MELFMKLPESDLVRISLPQTTVPNKVQGLTERAIQQEHKTKIRSLEKNYNLR